MNASPQKSAPSRFRQFSLRALLALILLCAVGLALWSIYIEPYQRQRRLVEKIAELKGVATTEAVPTFWSGVFGDNFFINIVAIELPGARIDDAWMSNLRGTPRLRALNLTSTAIGDAGLAHIAPLKHLQHLSINGTKVTDASMVHVQGLDKLESLGLNQTSVTDNGLALLANLTRLKVLHLQGCPVGDEGMAHLRGLSDLTTLDLRDTQVTDEGITHLVGLSKLWKLLLDNTEITEACLADLKKLPALTEVSTSGTHIIPSALRQALPGLDEKKFAIKLEEPTVIEFVETPLNDLALYLTDYHRSQIWLSRRSLQEAGVSDDMPVTKSLKNKPLGEALVELLEPKGLKCIARTGVLTITTKENAGDLRPRLILKPGEKLSGKFRTRLYAQMPIEFTKTPLADVLSYTSDYLSTVVQLAEDAFPSGFGGTEITHNSFTAAADSLELLFHELDIHGVIENNKIYLYPGPVPEDRNQP